MRQIKFRAWDLGKKRMVVNFTLASDGTPLKQVSHEEGCPHCGEEIKGWHDEAENFKLMQYTGLTDKNGKEIYEGDIVKSRFKLEDVEDHIYMSLTDKEKKEQAKLFLIEDIFFPYTIPMPDDLEIIGNIYENKELLK